MIGLAALTMILALWSLGWWLGYREKMEHPPRYQGRYRTPCLDVSVHQDHIPHSSRPLELC
jgi:hypothetical protein